MACEMYHATEGSFDLIVQPLFAARANAAGRRDLSKSRRPNPWSDSTV